MKENSKVTLLKQPFIWVKRNLTKLNVPFVDDCCDAENLPIKFNKETGQVCYYDDSIDDWSCLTSLPPTVTCATATTIAQTTATLNGSWANNVGANTVNFSYGPIAAYPHGGNVTTNEPATTATGTYTANLTGLTANTQYYYTAELSTGEKSSACMFTTLADVLVPPIATIVGVGTPPCDKGVEVTNTHGSLNGVTCTTWTSTERRLSIDGITWSGYEPLDNSCLRVCEEDLSTYLGTSYPNYIGDLHFEYKVTDCGGSHSATVVMQIETDNNGVITSLNGTVCRMPADLASAGSASVASIPVGGSCQFDWTISNVGGVPTDGTPVNYAIGKPNNGTFTLIGALPAGWTVLINTGLTIIFRTTNILPIGYSQQFSFIYQHDGTNQSGFKSSSAGVTGGGDANAANNSVNVSIILN